jgi:hypothetical protein
VAGWEPAFARKGSRAFSVSSASGLRAALAAPAKVRRDMDILLGKGALLYHLVSEDSAARF